LARPQTVDYLLPLEARLRWRLRAGDAAAAGVVAQLAKVMQLSPAPDEASSPAPERQFVVVSDDGASASASPNEVIIRLDLDRPVTNEWLRGPVMLSLALARACVPHGGLLMHGALAEREGLGVLLLAPGGTGKTTASRRLPAPWRSVCDDTTFLQRGAGGQWRARPWPTWSRFPEDSPGESWNVQAALPLCALFHLKQAPHDGVTPLRPGRAAGRLAQSNEEASLLMTYGLTPEHARALRRQRFDGLCALAQEVPMFTLELSLAGAFWQEIEKTLGWPTRLA
jgi:SynChlorMet cassette protein ScmC